jgi:hypothetical protein
MVAQRCRPTCRRLRYLTNGDEVSLAERASSATVAHHPGVRRGDVCHTLGCLLCLMAGATMVRQALRTYVEVGLF